MRTPRPPPSCWRPGTAAASSSRGPAPGLLAAACDVPVANLAAESLGRREALLLALRERTFGPWLDGLATCPACASELEVAFSADDVLVPRRA